MTTHLQGCEYIADLYSGCGTYSFPLLAQAKRVSAYEGNDAMIAAMHNAILKAKLENKMSATARDLYKNPLTATELKHYDGIVINPSRNGALPQVKQIANSHLKKLVMVSCSPNSFKRDAKHLLDAGWRMIEATPIDQFYWSAHLEIVAIFTK